MASLLGGMPVPGLCLCLWRSAPEAGRPAEGGVGGVTGMRWEAAQSQLRQEYEMGVGREGSAAS